MKARKPKFAGQKPPPPPPPIHDENQEESYEVERILASKRGPGGHVQYLIRWEGYDREHDSWEKFGNLEGAQEALKEFHEQNPDAPQHANLTIGRITFRDPRLFNEATGQHGDTYVTPPKEKQGTDWMLPLSTEETNQLLDSRKLPTGVPIPKTVKHIWIIENETIDFVVIMENHQPVRLYRLMKETRTVTKRDKEAPTCLLRDHAYRKWRIW